jgi:EmrB/QacA subfamily drug resistance transporter
MESTNRRWAVLATCCLSLLIVGLDATIMNMALPSLRDDLGASVSGLQWTLDAYVLVLASLLVLSGSTADRFGRKRVFQTGLVTFTVASLLCSLAPGLGWLIAFRALQGVGASMLNPVAMSIITTTFTDRAERARAIGVWGGVVGLSMALGPVLGGLLVEVVGWRAIFWINVPVGILALVLTARLVPESRAERARRFDPAGQVLIVAALTAVVAAIIEGPRLGWGSAAVIGLFTLAAVSAVLLVVVELRRAEPLIDPRFFTSVPFAGATLIAVCAFTALAGFLFLNSLYLQEVRGLSALHAGLYTLPMAAVTVVAAPISGRVVGGRGPRLPLIWAGVMLTVSAFMLHGIDENTSMAWLFVAYAVFGLGFGAVNAPITNTAVTGMPLAQAGVAAAVASTSRQVGTSLGVAVVGTVVSAASVAAGSGALAAAVTDASPAGWWIITGCGAGVLLLGVLTTGRWARATSDRAGARLAAAASRRSEPVGAR